MLVIPSGSLVDTGYKLTRSLRLRASNSAYLSRAPSGTGNRKTWTLSLWMKLGTPGYLFSVGGSGTNYCSVYSFATGMYLYNVDGGVATLSANITASMRDPAAWYHLVLAVDTTQATASNRVKVWLNGLAQTVTLNVGAQNVDTQFNQNIQHQIGCTNLGGLANFHDGLITEFNFLDGVVKTASDFGEIGATTGVWKPKTYTGSYGTNGFYLPFTDNSALTTSSNVGLGKDFSGNGNYWTTNNISITAGATYDSFTDVPTLTSATASNFCTLNPLVVNNATGQTAQIYYAANMEVRAFSDTGAVTYSHTQATQVLTGLKYWEVTLISASTNDAMIGIVNLAASELVGHGKGVPGLIYSGNGGGYYRSGSVFATGSTVNASGAAYTAGAVIGVAYDATTQKLWFSLNGVWQGAGADPSTGANPNVSGLPASGIYIPAVSQYNSSSAQYAEFRLNCGQRPFAYTPPTGFLPLNTFNLPAPTIVQGNKYFDATLYTGNAGTQTIVNAGGFQPDFAWVKSRSVANNNIVVDSVRGATSYMVTNNNGIEGTNAAMVASLNSNGLTLGSDTTLNTNASTGVAWQWKKGATPGLDVVTYVGNGAARTINHALGVAPKLVIVKDRSGVNNWLTWHSALGGTEYLNLNTTDAKLTSAGVWNSTLPTSSVFSVGASSGSNNNGANYVAYLWSEIAGFSKFGSYVGNGSTDGPFVYCGFRPRYVMAKRTDATSGWVIMDTARDPYNVMGQELTAHTSNAELTFAEWDALSNGFKLRQGSAGMNASAGTYIFAAFAEHPFKHALAR